MTGVARCVLISAFAFGLVSCVPWTVRPIDYKEPTSTEVQTPAAYVDSMWSARLIPAVTSKAVDARELLNALAASASEARTRYGYREANGPYHFILKGTGVVTTVELGSRVGLALVDIAPFDKKPDVSIQIGPVLRGSSLRDATGLVRFSDFINQLQFADVANELNKRVLTTVLEPLDRSRLKGRTVSFVGTLAASEEAKVPLPEVVPVVLRVEDAPR